MLDRCAQRIRKVNGRMFYRWLVEIEYSIGDLRWARETFQVISDSPAAAMAMIQAEYPGIPCLLTRTWGPKGAEHRRYRGWEHTIGGLISHRAPEQLRLI